jgi:hypothetical protein
VTAAVSVFEVQAPCLRAGDQAPVTASAVAGVEIDAAVNLAEDRRFASVPLRERLAAAVVAQRSFLNGLLDPQLGAIVDLRIIREPGDGPLRVGLLVRAMAASGEEAARRARELAETINHSMPDHLTRHLIEGLDELNSLQNPLPDGVADASFVTRSEITAVPIRPDIRRQYDYLYSVVPFSNAVVDWAGVYQRLLACREPVVISVALRPLAVPPELAHLLSTYATLYGHWSRPEQRESGPFDSTPLPAESFAVDAAAAFADYAQRLSQRCFAIRAMVASSAPLPAGLPQLLGATIAGIDGDDESVLTGRRASSAYMLRRDSQPAAVARWDLQVVDLQVPRSDAKAWHERDPPPDLLADLPVLGDAREAACAFRLPIALTGDLPGVRVRRGRSGHTEAMAGGERPIYLGTVDSGSGTVFVEANSLSKHALIAGTTGSGKTTLVLNLLRQLWPAAGGEFRRIPFLVIEPVNDDANDYRKLVALPEFADDLEIYTVGDERFNPLHFNPFAVPDRVLVGEHISALLSAFCAAFGLWDPLPAIYEEALAEAYAAAGILPSETAGEVEGRRWPTVVGFLAAMERATARIGYKGDVKANLDAASVIRAKQLVFGRCASAFRTDRGLDVERLLSRPTIIELKTLANDADQALMIALLTNAITEHYKATRGAQRELQHVTVIEEAHRLLGRAKGGSGSAQDQAREKAAEAFANVLAENRKYGEGIVIAEQIPTKLVEDAVKNTNLKVMCRLSGEDERNYLGLSMAMSDEQRLAAARLAIGEAFVYSDQLPNTMEVQAAPPFEGDPDVSRCWTAPGDRTPPFDFCAVCHEQCQWRPVGLALSRRPSVLTAAEALQRSLRQPMEGSKRNELARQLVTAVGKEVRRYPWIGERGGHAGPALCTVVHSLESRTSKRRWAEWCARAIERDPVRPEA